MLIDQLHALKEQARSRLAEINKELNTLAVTIQDGLNLQADLLREKGDLERNFGLANGATNTPPVVSAVVFPPPPTVTETVVTTAVATPLVTPAPPAPAVEVVEKTNTQRGYEFIASRGNQAFTRGELQKAITPEGASYHPSQTIFTNLFLDRIVREGQVYAHPNQTYLARNALHTMIAQPAANPTGPTTAPTGNNAGTSPTGHTHGTSVTVGKKTRRLGPVSLHGDYPPGVAATTRALVDYLRTNPHQAYTLDQVEAWYRTQGVTSSSNRLRHLAGQALGDLVARGCLSRVGKATYQAANYRNYTVPPQTPPSAPTVATLDDFLSSFPTQADVDAPLSTWNRQVLEAIRNNHGVTQQGLRDHFYPGDNTLRAIPRENLPTGEWKRLEDRRWSINSSIECLKRHGLISALSGSYFPVSLPPNATLANPVSPPAPDTNP